MFCETKLGVFEKRRAWLIQEFIMFICICIICYMFLFSEERKGKMTTMSSDPKSSGTFSFLSGIRYEHLVAGVSGGVISTCILHPLDLLKIR